MSNAHMLRDRLAWWPALRPRMGMGAADGVMARGGTRSRETQKVEVS